LVVEIEILISQKLKCLIVWMLSVRVAANVWQIGGRFNAANVLLSAALVSE
jgi:hypothetical protein